MGCDHGSLTIPSVKGKRVVILDFSFKEAVLKQMIQDADQLLIIDHHDSAVQELKDIPEKYKVFNMFYSGATMAWAFFHRGILAPQFLLYIEDRDLWKWQLKQSKEVCAGLDTLPQTFEQWDQLNSADAIRNLKVKGEAVIQYRNNLVESIAGKSSQREFGGFLCRAVNTCGGSIVSYIGDALLTQYNVPVALMWYLDYPSKQFKVSLRSQPEIDCSALAKRYGGGGHKQSSAFTVSLDDAALLAEFTRAVLY
jgi:oligoribonuclease NrnB/cAMP/cGMP phosphodiesterase (DHH superfamily)